MHQHLNPIEKHKSEIEKRISQLQQKFRQRDLSKGNTSKRVRQPNQDENRISMHRQPGPQISKTMEVRGKIRPQQGVGKRSRELNYQISQKEPLGENTGVIKNVRDSRMPSRDAKDDKIKQLYAMMKQIIEGQKNIEKEINELKKEKDSPRKQGLQGHKLSFVQDNNTPLDLSIQRVPPKTSKEKTPDKSHKKNAVLTNNSILIRETAAQAKHGKNLRQKKAKAKKQCDFDVYLEELKGQSKVNERNCVGQEWKSKIWIQVQQRVKESEKQYKDTIHRNNKHEFDHLTNTFELQRKLKDDLLEKIYQQCNSQIYK